MFTLNLTGKRKERILKLIITRRVELCKHYLNQTLQD